MSALGESYRLQNLALRNRIVMPPMCQYSASAKDGMPTEWHRIHYVSRAVGGTGLIIMEMTNVEPDGRITDHCLGLWSQAQAEAFAGIIRECQTYGAKVGIQIAHAGRKAEDAQQPVAPSAVPIGPGMAAPRALSTAEVEAMVERFRESVRLAVAAGVDTIELHGAHGYLIHQFHSPALNRRDDAYGQEASRFGVEVIRAVKSQMPAGMPLLMRISAVEYMDGGYEEEHMLRVAADYKAAGVDLFHISSGGEGPVGTKRRPANTPGYQLPFARRFREELGLPVIAVGLLDDPALANRALEEGDADLVAVGRGMLRDPYWALHALAATGGAPAELAPRQYQRAF